MIGLETALALAITHLVKPGHMSLSHLLEKLTTNPADLYHLDAGYIAVGGKADMVVFSEDESWTVEREKSNIRSVTEKSFTVTAKFKMRQRSCL